MNIVSLTAGFDGTVMVSMPAMPFQYRKLSTKIFTLLLINLQFWYFIRKDWSYVLARAGTARPVCGSNVALPSLSLRTSYTSTVINLHHRVF